MELWTAFMLGILSGFHCIGMCGPIALALPLGNRSFAYRISGTILYNSGRIFTYTLIGMLFGTIGRGFQMAGAQQLVSIIVGIVMILSVLFPMLLGKRLDLSPSLFGLFHRIKSSLSHLFQKRTASSLWSIGVINGLLPCGMVYMAIAGSISSETAIDGGLYMTFFGLGTLPVMLTLPLFGGFLGVKSRNYIKRIIPMIVLVMGILFVLRGLNLGIPYVSPKIFYEINSIAPCN